MNLWRIGLSPCVLVSKEGGDEVIPTYEHNSCESFGERMDKSSTGYDDHLKFARHHQKKSKY